MCLGLKIKRFGFFVSCIFKRNTSSVSVLKLYFQYQMCFIIISTVELEVTFKNILIQKYNY